MRERQKVATFKLLGKMFPKYTVGEAQKALDEGVDIKEFKLKNLQKRSNNLQAIA